MTIELRWPPVFLRSTDKISAVDIVRIAVPELGGKGGGGRPDLAQGGGSDISGADGA